MLHHLLNFALVTDVFVFLRFLKLLRSFLTNGLCPVRGLALNQHFHRTNIVLFLNHNCFEFEQNQFGLNWIIIDSKSWEFHSNRNQVGLLSGWFSTNLYPTMKQNPWNFLHRKTKKRVQIQSRIPPQNLINSSSSSSSTFPHSRPGVYPWKIGQN